eukprot:COSAG06_NODE_45821_length_351_cov_9.547619_1_plen_62_part_01
MYWTDVLHCITLSGASLVLSQSASDAAATPVPLRWGLLSRTRRPTASGLRRAALGVDGPDLG